MTASESTSPHQFGEMHRRLKRGKGFTYDPRKQDFVTEGYSVAAHPAAELTVPHTEGGATEAHIEGYTVGSAPVWASQKSKGRGQEMIGGWRTDEGGKDVLDIPKVFPATPTGHAEVTSVADPAQPGGVLQPPRGRRGSEPVVHRLRGHRCGAGTTVGAVPRVRQPRRQEPASGARPGEVPGDRLVGQQADGEAGYEKEAKRKARGQP